MASLVEQLAQHIDREIAKDLKVCKMLLEISQELYVSMNIRKKLIDEFKEKDGSMVDMTSICFLDGLQYQEMNMRVDTLKHVNEGYVFLAVVKTIRVYGCFCSLLFCVLFYAPGLY
ncbi:hypothetical protein Tco_1457366 [Tanacetum coccineum]